MKMWGLLGAPNKTTRTHTQAEKCLEYGELSARSWETVWHARLTGSGMMHSHSTLRKAWQCA